MVDALTLTQTRIREGVWEGVLVGSKTAPALQVLLLEQALAGVTVVAVPGRPDAWQVRAPIPAQSLSEGVQTFLMQVDGETLGHFTIVTGVAMEDDLRAEIDLLRAELDLLKRAFRRHCLETAG